MAIVVNIIGAGHLGRTIGHLLVKCGLVEIGAICNTTELSSQNAINFIRQGKYYPHISQLPAADITFITTPDDLIPSISEELSRSLFLQSYDSLD